jgi:hypothetical protein
MRSGKHRTEVTEVTEGDSDRGREFRSDILASGARTVRKVGVSHRLNPGYQPQSLLCDLCAMLFFARDPPLDATLSPIEFVKS